MCQELIAQTKMVCGDKIDSPGAKIPCKDECGEYKPNYSIGVTTKKVLCDDCIASRKWVKDANNKWIRA